MSTPGSSVFAIIIGIDSYKSGSIWNLQYCVDDAKRMERWLCEDLEAPKENIKVLLDSQATKEHIESAFMDHLVNNPTIQHGDAILVYFAGHGSHVSAPKDWYKGMRKQRAVEVLCTYDYDTRDAQRIGRIAGICDRSMHAMLNDVAKVKGDNITLILDTCCLPSQTPENIRERSQTRWTPSGKTTGEDLYRGLWLSARADPLQSRFGFLEPCPTNYMILAACSPGNIAVEGREGGHFTAAFLQAASAVALHRTSYAQLFDYINRAAIEDGQKAVCLGKHKNRIVLNDTPFTVDGRFLAVALCTKREVRLEAGSVHGVIEGCELSLHPHNYRRSKNPILATVAVVETHPTWSLAQIKNQDLKLPKSCWGRITRWNNEPPFRVKLKASIASIMTIWKLKKEFPNHALRTLRLSGVTAQGVGETSEANISIKVQKRNIIVERHDTIGVNGSRVINIRDSDPVKVINEAATFGLRLQSNNPTKPLENVVRVGLHDVDGHLVQKVGHNLLNPDAKTIIHPDDRNNMMFCIVIRNMSRLNLWPYIFAMDPDIYATTLIYQPLPQTDSSDDTDTDRSQKNIRARLPPPPLLAGGLLDVVLNWPGETYSNSPYKSGFLKLILCSTPVGSLGLWDNSQISFMIQGHRLSRSPGDPRMTIFDEVSTFPWIHQYKEHIWDSFLYPVVFVINSDMGLSALRRL